jgi:hypothetical protein
MLWMRPLNYVYSTANTGHICQFIQCRSFPPPPHTAYLPARLLQSYGGQENSFQRVSKYTTWDVNPIQEYQQIYHLGC